MLCFWQILEEIMPNDIILGCSKYCEEMKLLCDYLTNIVESDYSNESKVKGIVNQWLNNKAEEYKINVIYGLRNA